MEHKGHVLVRATLSLSGLRRGEHALVDPEQPYMKDALASGALVLAEEAPASWACVECGASDGRTELGALLCHDCRDAIPPGAQQ